VEKETMNKAAASLVAVMKHGRLPILALLLLAGGCGSKAVVAPPPPPQALPKKALAPMGYSIQVGAFMNVNNAIHLTESLEQQGLSVYYFRHETGFYKVRFGDFPSKEAAAAKADRLEAAGFIDDYYLVSPEDYAAAKARIYGERHLRKEIVETAESFVGLPYRWGGSSPEDGFDCSGLAMAVYQHNGLNLPRSSKSQYRAGTPVRPGDVDKGDLVFFATSGGRRVSHVGVYAGNNRFVHAPGRGKTIRINSLADRYYATRYVGARTYMQ
jgi:hypothetical protein